MRSLLALVVVLLSSAARSTPVDWKFYGGTSLYSSTQYCFYDANSLSYQKDGVRVWTKCLSTAEMNNANPNTDSSRAAIDAAAHRMARYYIPPIAMATHMTRDQIDSTIIAETEANSLDLQPVASIYYELDCQERKERELSLYFKGFSSRDDGPRPWFYVPPEGNGAMLLTLTCPKR